MSRVIKPGQYQCFKGYIVRAKKRDETGCKDCILNNVFLCPDMPSKHSSDNKPDCRKNGIIFVKP